MKETFLVFSSLSLLLIGFNSLFKFFLWRKTLHEKFLKEFLIFLGGFLALGVFLSPYFLNQTFLFPFSFALSLFIIGLFLNIVLFLNIKSFSFGLRYFIFSLVTLFLYLISFFILIFTKQLTNFYLPLPVKVLILIVVFSFSFLKFKEYFLDFIDFRKEKERIKNLGYFFSLMLINLSIIFLLFWDLKNFSLLFFLSLFLKSILDFERFGSLFQK